MLLLTVDMVSLDSEALVVVWVVISNFPSVVAASTLSACLAAAHSILDVVKVGLLVPGLFVGVRLEFECFQVGVLEI